MEVTEVRPKFISWVETKTNEKVSTLHPFLLACLEEQIGQTINSKYNGVPFYQHYPEEELMNEILSGWHSTAKSFLQMQPSNVNIVFRRVELPEDELRMQLLSKITDLAAKCS